uniref:ATP synthase F0 subunit 8 n=1 Tax=Bourletiella arvalis TaxID=2049373 RepID=A0A3B1EF60_9HEXA|nr:ATP synthase F0 subunit 8 [Bourletiella arvalis]ATP01402.1 ATP synthase F0 subunit 8 [Bourletiella arvalis]
MPQMAPMMWQTIYVSCIILLIISMNKNFFTKMNAVKNGGLYKMGYEEKSWKW